MAVFPKVLGGTNNNVHSVNAGLDGLLGVADVASNVCRIVLGRVYEGLGGMVGTDESKSWPISSC